MGTRGLFSPERAISSKNLVAHMAPFLIFILASGLNAATSASLGPSPSPTTTTTTTRETRLERGSVCHLPMEDVDNPCEACFRWYSFDGSTCVEVNCGCGSTGNSFDTKEQCEEVCSSDFEFLHANISAPH